MSQVKRQSESDGHFDEKGMKGSVVWIGRRFYSTGMNGGGDRNQERDRRV